VVVDALSALPELACLFVCESWLGVLVLVSEAMGSADVDVGSSLYTMPGKNSGEALVLAVSFVLVVCLFFAKEKPQCLADRLTD
jgi:hypothetical protein